MEDTNGVTKFELTDDEYSKKTGTVRDFMKKNKMGKYNPEEVAQIEKEKAEAEQMEKEAASKIAVADRCEVAVPGQATRRGNIFILWTPLFGWLRVSGGSIVVSER